MLTTCWQRLVRECLIRIYRDERTKHAINFPVYYFAYHGDVKTLGLSVQSLQQIPDIPWPDKQCVILAENAPASIMCPDWKSLVCIVHDENCRAVYACPGGSDLVYCGATFLVGNVVFHSQPKLYFLSHLADGVEFEIDDENWSYVRAQEHMDQLVEVWDTASKRVKGASFNSKPNMDAFAQYLQKTSVWENNKPLWVAYDLPDKNPQPGLAADFLAYLSNLAIPCHYMVKTRFKQGFGPTGEMKRLTAAKPIFSIVNFERLHKVYAKTGAETGIELDPHFRRGHIRHFWKESGLDRLVLPVAHSERMLLVHRRQVRRRYIQPQWIGDPEFSSDGCDFEIITKDMPLPLL